MNKIMKVTHMIMELIDEAELGGICQGDLEAMVQAKAMRIVKEVQA